MSLELSPGTDLATTGASEERARRPWLRPGSPAARLALLVVLSVVAFRYSLGTLMRSLGVDSPLAYLGLVPVISLLLGMALARPRVNEPEVHDRYLDRILGIPMIAVSLLVLMVLPAQMSTFFWLWRIDLLALPIFVAGCVVWLFGTRTLLRVTPALLFLLAAWPIPFRMLLARFLDGFTSLSATAIERIVAVVPLAHPIPSLDGGFEVPSPTGSFEVLIATECSGANGLLGFLLIAGGLMLAAKGSWRRKALWLAAGSVVVWLLNLARMLSIFVVGRFWGERVAIDAFHPYVGLVTFSVATLIAVWFLPRFGITFGGGRRSWRDLDASVRGGVPRVWACAVALLVVAVVAGAFNSDLRRVNPVASALGAARVVPFGNLDSAVPGYRMRAVDRFEWATRFFGEDSDWTRYQLRGEGTAQLGGQLSVTADVVTTTRLEAFDDFGVEACYRFHGYSVDAVDEVDLGRGQIATMLSWQDRAAPIRWTALFWYWPVAGREGDGQRYQRVVLLVNSSTDVEVRAPEVVGRATTDVGMSVDRALQGRDGAGELSARDIRLRAFLTGIGREVVASSTPEDES